jgi:hypothetical protein
MRERSGACSDQIVAELDTAHLATVLQSVLAAVACHLQVERHAINASAGQHAPGPWHINNVNGTTAA